RPAELWSWWRSLQPKPHPWPTPPPGEPCRFRCATADRAVLYRRWSLDGRLVVIQGFKEFILRGNVIDLAIAVVIGTAFFALIDAIVTNLVNPFIAALGSPDTGGLAFQLREGMPAT